MNFLSDAGEEGDWMNGSVYAGCMDRFALPDAMAFLVDQVSLATSYLSAAIKRCLAFESSKTVLTWYLLGAQLSSELGSGMNDIHDKHDRSEDPRKNPLEE
jgi:hypothetical protein